jgi:hypothetical protein
MQKVIVWRFRVYNNGIGDQEIAPRYASKDAIAGIKTAVRIDGSEIEIDPALLDGNGMMDENFRR